MRLSLQPRARPARAMVWLSPVIAAVLSVIGVTILFALLGRNPVEALYTLFVGAAGDAGRVVGTRAEGDAAAALRGRHRHRRARRCVEHRRRGPVHARRHRRRRRRAGVWRAGTLVDHPGDAAGRHRRRHGLGGDPRAAAHPLQRARNPDHADAGLRRRSSCSAISCMGRGRTPKATASRRRGSSSRMRTLPLLIAGTRLHIGALFALLAVPLGSILLGRTMMGFRIRTVGAAPAAARYAGFSRNAIGLVLPAAQRRPRRAGRHLRDRRRQRATRRRSSRPATVSRRSSSPSLAGSIRSASCSRRC